MTAERALADASRLEALDPGPLPLYGVVAADLAAVPFADDERIDPIVRVFVETGRKMSAGDYVNALATMHNTAREIVQALVRHDVLLTPTLARPAPRIGELPHARETYVDGALARLPFTFPFNATGRPACSVPNGLSTAGLPIGLQISTSSAVPAPPSPGGGLNTRRPTTVSLIETLLRAEDEIMGRSSQCRSA